MASVSLQIPRQGFRLWMAVAEMVKWGNGGSGWRSGDDDDDDDDDGQEEDKGDLEADPPPLPT